MKSKAQGLGDEILEAFPNAKIFLEGGHPGQFDIIYESDPPALLYSKEVTNRYPKEGEIVVLLK